MTYRPMSTQAFGPPVVSRLPSLVYLTLALSLLTVIIVGSWSPQSTC